MNQSQEQLKEIIAVVLSYARFDFTQKARIFGDCDLMDSLASGINMLGEEMHASTLSLREKELMLKEIHHRVKNNLQIISSLLRLQSEFSNDPEVVEKFEECQARIGSMAILHEKLYASKNLKHIELSDYIESVGRNIVDSSAHVDDINYHFQAAPLSYYFDLDHLLPVGLIFNELLSNSIKHGFKNHTAPKLSVKILEDGEHIELSVQDNGTSVEKIEQLFESNSLGLQLVESLTEQIDGSIAYQNTNGLLATLRFSKYA